jgi:ribosomal protein S18 acetylase RimI-like enzyme
MPLLRAHGLHLREFVESDEDEVTSWFADAGELRFFAGRRLTWPLDAGQWRSIRLDPSVTAWSAVGEDDAVPVGHGELISEGDSVARLARLAISPALRGQGIGKALVGTLVNRSREDGCRMIYLYVHPNLSTAIRGYRSIGFEPALDQSTSRDLRMELEFDRT